MGMIEKIKNFYKIEKAEAKRITWPSRKELGSHSILILVVSLILAIIFAVVDQGFQILVTWLIKTL
ncbi:preprotein translocase subunit SecE [Candidatus Calescamantes bacterium]|nr:preprotein translocase subunit SecE [bacterium]MCK5223456.1 preprotein translocase subunit SecE [Candidatus Calescamantes bacterium]MCK5598167.1 preprotein translocase subunit SecE [bacterium]